jgi:hypothetical protein
MRFDVELGLFSARVDTACNEKNVNLLFSASVENFDMRKRTWEPALALPLTGIKLQGLRQHWDVTADPVTSEALQITVTNSWLEMEMA